ncbi:mast cell-expressed membrane protein 1 isoform X3 [Bos taurus]|uniref:mast cell-expressed membrane protein 1 isoform X3 n=1 Tax=Bos taurus TaxID=9913 RepID=UPI00076042E3|nr:mast cell-expressed membrane protein 1 isoform X3 [Bos taurus]
MKTNLLPGTIETEEIYINQVKMQPVAFKDKRRGSSGNKEDLRAGFLKPLNDLPTAADDPNYENITFTFKNQNRPKGSHSPPKNKDSEMSRELVVLKEELWNVSTSVQEYQEEQKTQWGNVKQSVMAAKKSIDTVMTRIQEGNPKRTQLATVPNIDEVKKTLQEILSTLKTSKPSPTPQ